MNEIVEIRQEIIGLRALPTRSLAQETRLLVLVHENTVYSLGVQCLNSEKHPRCKELYKSSQKALLDQGAKIFKGLWYGMAHQVVR